MPLQKLVGNIYSVLVEILLWILPITGAVAGYIAAENILYDEKRFLWVVLGIIAGLLVDVILFGPVIILFNIRASLKNIENK
jgi:hypothetical protein